MKLEKVTLSEQIYQQLRKDIINQTLPAGEKITVKMIQEHFSTSYTPAREAIRRLAQEGLLESVTNVGATVITLTKKDIREIYDFCFALDNTAMCAAMEEETSDNFILAIAKNIRLQEDALSAEDFDTFRKLSDDFHDLFFQYANNSRLYHAAELLRSQLTILTNKYQLLPSTMACVAAEHKKIADALEKHHLSLASELLKNISNRKKTICLNVPEPFCPESYNNLRTELL